MFINYLKLSFRLMIRNPFFTFINVVGLSVGFTAFYILWPYSQNELNSDRFHKDYKQIARLSRSFDLKENGISSLIKLPVHNSGIARQFLRDYPEITALTGIIPQQYFELYRQGFDKDVFVSVKNRNGTKVFFREQNLAFADSNFFQFFSFPLVSGDPANVLQRPETAVISASHSVKYFGEEDPVNRTIYFNDSIPVTITGVYKDLPKNTHIKADVLISTAGIPELNLTSWDKNWWGHYYIKVTKETDLMALEKKINDERDRIYGKCPRCPAEAVTSVLIQPLKTIVFTDFLAYTAVVKSEYLLIAMSVLAFVIPLLAWINHISLTVHMLQKRISEMGVRKAVGAGRRHFIAQFVVEAALANILALLISFTLAQFVKGFLETWLSFYTISWNELPSSTIWIVFGLFLSGIIITSAYPIMISSSNRSMLLVKKIWSYKSPQWINIIVTSQYSAAIVLLISVICVYFQLNLIFSRSLGIEKDGVIVIDCPLQQKLDFKSKLDYFTDKISIAHGIQGVTVSKSVVGDYAGYGIPVQRNMNGIEFGLDTNGGVDHNFLKVYGIKLLHGRNFRPDMPTDRNTILLSRNATERMLFSRPEEAIGARLILPWYGKKEVEVIGVYEDYEFRPFLQGYYQGKRGSFLAYSNYLMPDYFPSKISLRLDFEEFQSCLAKVDDLFKETFPQDDFRWTYLDQNVQKHYTTEKVARNQIGFFTLVAIGIACLGLLGLISNKVAEKTKEIGIRKVLGAELYHVGQLLLNTTIRQVVIATLISIPTAYYLARLYLEKFTERITLQWWHFAFPLAALVLIMFATIAAVVWKAARSNPVEALKHE